MLLVLINVHAQSVMNDVNDASVRISYPTLRWSTRASVRQVAAEIASRLRLSVQRRKKKVWVKKRRQLRCHAEFCMSAEMGMHFAGACTPACSSEAS